MSIRHKKCSFEILSVIRALALVLANARMPYMSVSVMSFVLEEWVGDYLNLTFSSEIAFISHGMFTDTNKRRNDDTTMAWNETPQRPSIRMSSTTAGIPYHLE